jgi:hypothetical protein
MDGKQTLLAITNIGMYDGEPYGDEVEGGDEDRNDGLNALVRITFLFNSGF